MARLAPGAPGLRFMSTAEMDVGGVPCRVSPLGYTGEDGFEISVAAERAEALARAPARRARRCTPAGLGARDSLRLEAGLCLYGHDIDDHDHPGRGRARLDDRQAPARRGRLPRRRP